jgi:NAD(P)-dependent dehydrogenase (short-subunit alcohol dehydrogenase family)
MEELEKVAIVTGGAKGVGEGCAQALTRVGGRVVICDIDVETGQQLASRLSQKEPGICHFEECDVRLPEQIKRVIETTVRKWGRLDCLVNNAGWHPPGHPIDDFSLEDFQELLQLNLVAVFAGCKFALPHLRKTRGSIINIGSLVASIGDESASTYCATKGGVSALTKALAIDEARHGVRVNVILPGNVVTPLRIKSLAKSEDPEGWHNWLESNQWTGRSGTIEEIGQVCQFLASEAASFITGAELVVSGGAELGYGIKVQAQKTE